MQPQLASSKLSGSLTRAKTLEVRCESLEPRLMLAGNVTANISGAGNLIITGDNEANQISVEIASDGAASVTGSSGTTVDLGNLATERVERDVRITLRGGDDDLTLTGSGASVPVRDIRVNTGSGNDMVLLDQLYDVQRDVQISAGQGDDMVGVQYAGVARNLTLNGSSGMNLLMVDDTEVGQEEDLGDLRVSSTSGDDTVKVTQTTVYGDLDVRPGGGDDRVEIEDSFAMYGGGINVRSGSGNDEVYLTASGTIVPPDSGKYAGVSLKTAGGDDIVDVSEMSGQELTVNTGNGSDDVVITGCEVDTMDFRMGSGDDVVSFGAGNTINTGPFRINGNGGTDEAIDFGTVASPEPAELISIENET